MKDTGEGRALDEGIEECGKCGCFPEIAPIEFIKAILFMLI